MRGDSMDLRFGRMKNLVGGEFVETERGEWEPVGERGARVARAVCPGGRPAQLSGRKARGAHLEQDVSDSG